MDHEDLEITPSALLRERLKPGLAAIPLVVGLLIALILVVPGAPPAPRPRSITQCDTVAALDTLEVCQEHIESEVAKLAGVKEPLSERAKELLVDGCLGPEAREAVLKRAEWARNAHVSAYGWHAEQTAAVTARRWSALWPAGLGAVLSALLGVVLWWRRPRVHRVRLSAHHVEINGRRLPLADLDEIVLDVGACGVLWER